MNAWEARLKTIGLLINRDIYVPIYPIYHRGYSLIQYPHSRQGWIGKHQDTGKLCLTIAVCEQHEEAMMGNTATLLTDFAIDIGLGVTDCFKALGFFDTGSVREDTGVPEEAVGEKLLQALQQPAPEAR